MIDRHPFRVLLPQQVPALRRRAQSLCSNPHMAEDLVQTTLLKAWASRDSYLPGSNLRAWLFTILRNTFFSELRKHRREVEDVDGACARALSEEPRHDHVLAMKELISAIAQLPREQRRALVLMGAYGFSQLETADACDCTLGTVKSRVSRGRTTLNQAMARDELGHPARTPQAGRPLRTAAPDRTVAGSSRMAAGAGSD
ncbi:sigma-70 family RNA polymerase sigma factor [Pararhodobacter sp. SW119]|uniref:sigma-70 family RNA polymerase sigma factor n=1 Tax=Pararhodobacter sp. SW119 TaxID=2780075 RepID=UPI001AE05E74|nr:sigma-70 family RNA polymerase sigma factor [Pararhodobacter sp. SW119]